MKFCSFRSIGTIVNAFVCYCDFFYYEPSVEIIDHGLATINF